MLIQVDKTAPQILTFKKKNYYIYLHTLVSILTKFEKDIIVWYF